MFAGSNWRIRDKEGRTALHWCAGNADTKCLMELLPYADQFDLNEPDNQLMTPVQWFTQQNHPKHLLMLLRKRVDILFSDINGRTALHRAAAHRGIFA